MAVAAEGHLILGRADPAVDQLDLVDHAGHAGDLVGQGDRLLLLGDVGDGPGQGDHALAGLDLDAVRRKRPARL
jgi:hypothetical protein